MKRVPNSTSEEPDSVARGRQFDSSEPPPSAAPSPGPVRSPSRLSAESLFGAADLGLRRLRPSSTRFAAASDHRRIRTRRAATFDHGRIRARWAAGSAGGVRLQPSAAWSRLHFRAPRPASTDSFGLVDAPLPGDASLERLELTLPPMMDAASSATEADVLAFLRDPLPPPPAAPPAAAPAAPPTAPGPGGPTGPVFHIRRQNGKRIGPFDHETIIGSIRRISSTEREELSEDGEVSIPIDSDAEVHYLIRNPDLFRPRRAPLRSVELILPGSTRIDRLVVEEARSACRSAFRCGRPARSARQGPPEL